METIQKYSGLGGGIARITFKQDAQAVYSKMLRDSNEHLISGFGQMEFLALLGPRLSAEARTVHVQFMDTWSVDDADNPDLATAEHAENRRQLWRNYRRDQAAFSTMRAQSGFTTSPPPPTENEPRDLERFFESLEARFRSSNTENLNAIQKFQPLTNETPERMFARYNMLAKPLEEEIPQAMTREQLKTTYRVHLRSILSSVDAENIDRDVRDLERKRMNRGLDPLSRHEIHDLVLRQAREKAVEETKLRAVGMSNFQNSERSGRRNRTREENVNRDQPQNDKDRERRTCNSCGVRGHIARDCPTPSTTGKKDAEKGDRKRPSTASDDKSSGKPRLSLEERLGTPNPPPKSGRRNNSGARGVNPKNPHMTEGAVCTHCGIINHNADQCWTLHPELNPFMKRENAMMARVQREGENALKSIRAEQGAREERNKRYNDERLEQEKEDRVEEDDDERSQFMVMDVIDPYDDLPQSADFSDLFSLDDPALEAELQLMSSPISDSVGELRRLQQVADQKVEVHDWFTVGKGKTLPLSKNNLTYANAVKTRYGVTGSTPTPEPAADVRRSPRVQKRVRFAGTNGTPPPPSGKTTTRQSPGTPSKSPSPRPQKNLSSTERVELFFDNDTDLVHLPVTFPVKDMGAPTPGTTNLYEPPEGGFPPPPLLVPDNAVRHHSAPPIAKKKSPYSSVTSLCNSLRAVTAQAVRLEVELYELAKAEEEKAPLPVLMVQ